MGSKGRTEDRSRTINPFSTTHTVTKSVDVVPGRRQLNVTRQSWVERWYALLYRWSHLPNTTTSEYVVQENRNSLFYLFVNSRLEYRIYQTPRSGWGLLNGNLEYLNHGKQRLERRRLYGKPCAYSYLGSRRTHHCPFLPHTKSGDFWDSSIIGCILRWPICKIIANKKQTMDYFFVCYVYVYIGDENFW